MLVAPAARDAQLADEEEWLTMLMDFQDLLFVLFLDGFIVEMFY